MNKLFKVESSTPTKNESFCNKLVAEITTNVVTAFGTTETKSKETYYLFTKEENQVGKEGELPLDGFDIVVKPYVFIDEDTKETVNAELKYLYPKK